jgi:hypothetical protein
MPLHAKILTGPRDHDFRAEHLIGAHPQGHASDNDGKFA